MPVLISRSFEPRLLRNATLAETLPASHAASRLCGEAFPPEDSSRRKPVPPGRAAAVAGRTGFRRKWRREALAVSQPDKEHVCTRGMKRPMR